jgi:hypothetical protein
MNESSGQSRNGSGYSSVGRRNRGWIGVDTVKDNRAGQVHFQIDSYTVDGAHLNFQNEVILRVKVS